MDNSQTAIDQERVYKTYTMYKRAENCEPTLSPHRDTKTIYAMNDQTFHTPSFGDEEFDIPSIHGQQHATNGAVQNSHIPYAQMHHSAPQVGMMNPAQDGLAPPGGAPSYQQPLYLQEPHTPVTTHGSGAPAGNYIIQQQPGGQQRLLMMQPSQVQQVMSGPPTPSTPTQTAAPVYGSPQRASPPGTTSDDSDDSVPSHHSQLPGDAESLLPIHYCSASQQQQTALHQQISVGSMGLKRSSPEPIENGINRGQMQKKPKVQKKKKKRDPNEPQKPVSAYALFFRDTQAAIKGQNPNASFGEVSKIVASMWDGLDSDHKSVYKQKTEVAKKEYLKALAAYRASLVSKGGEQENQAMFNHNNGANYPGNYYQGQSYGNGHSPQSYVPSPAPQGYSPQNYQNNQTQGNYPGQPAQGYQPNPQQSPQNYQGGPMTHTSQPYQGVPGQSPQNYQGNPATSPPQCQPNLAQSPRSYQGGQSPPNYAANAGMSPPGYRQMPSQSPPMGQVHAAMQYHHSAQQPHQQQVHQYQQQQQSQQHHHHQQQQQQQQQQQHHQQMQQSPPQQHAQTQQHQQPQSHQQPQQQPSAQPQAQSPRQLSPKQEPGLEQQTNGNSGGPQQTVDHNENRSASCIRQGCPNPAVANSEWEDEYCSNECVVSHCRDVFSSWVASNSNQIQNFSAVK